MQCLRRIGQIIHAKRAIRKGKKRAAAFIDTPSQWVQIDSFIHGTPSKDCNARMVE
jgi:hypothetical protein